MTRPHPTHRLHPAYTRFARLAALRDRLAALLGPRPTPASPVRLDLEAMEDRVVPAGRPLPDPTIFVGSGVGHAPVVRGYSAETGTPIFRVPAYGPAFTGGVRVAAGDVTGDGFPDVAVAPGPGHAPLLRVLDGKTGAMIPGPLGSFAAFGPAVTGGVFVASADVNGDGRADVIAAAVTAAGPVVRAFSGTTGDVIAQFAVAGPAFALGMTLAAADVTGDGKAEVVVGSRTSGQVRTYDPLTGTVIAGPLGAFNAFGPGYTAGVHIGADALAGDATGDGVPDLAVGTGPGVTAAVKVFDGATGSLVRTITPFGAFQGGARTALAYVDDDEFADIVVGSGPGMATAVKVFDGDTGLQLPAPMGQYAPFAGAGGVFVAASNDPQYSLTTWVEDNGGTAVEGAAIYLKVKVEGTTPTTPAPTGTVYFRDVTNPYSPVVLATVTLSPGSTGTESVAEVVLAPGTLPAGTYTLRADYAGDSNYMYSPAGLSFTVSATPSDAPLPLAPAEECAAGPVGEAGGGGAATRGGTIGGVDAKDSVQATRSDLSSGGYGTRFGQDWAWTNAPGHSDGLSGSGATQAQAPHLARLNGDVSIAVVTGGKAALFFDYYQGAYHARYGSTATLTHNTGTHLFTLRDGTGKTLTFYDFSGSTPTGRAGRLKSTADPTGGTTEPTSWDGSGRPTEVQRVSGSGGGALTESFVSAYVASGANAGLLESVTQRTRIGTGSSTTVRTVEYAYYDGATGPGLVGNLKTAVVKDASGNVIDTTYYRYYTSGTGQEGKIQYAFGPAAHARLTAALGTSLDSLADGQVDDYADTYLDYDTDGRVVTLVSAGSGCSVCSGGQGTYTYAYTAGTGGLNDPNAWATKVVETLPDGSTNTVYANALGQVLLTAFDDVGASGEWVSYTQYDADGRVVLRAAPSAVTGYDDTSADLMVYSGGNAQYLSDSAGLVTTWEYAGTTTATTSTAGDAAGYLKSVAIRQGETGTAVPQAGYTYIQRTAGSDSFFHPASETAYRNDNGTGGQTTSYSYTFTSGTNHVEAVTTTLPTVTTAQNGSNSATSLTTVFDTFGRAIWSKDAGGFLTYVAYDDVTGAVTKVIADVNTANTSDFTGLPSGWSTPSGGGLHLISGYEVDGLGRVTKETTPEGRINYIVYNDANHEVRSYPGWDTTTNAPTGPTTVTREDRANGYTETLTMSATPSVSSGRPTGAESVAGVQSLSRSYVNAAGQVTQSDAYFNLSGLTYSTSASLGTEGTNFYRTRYAYDSHGLLNKTTSPEGTISRTVYDGQGRAVSEWVGTDDTPTTGYWSPTNLTGTDTVEVRGYEYDGGGVGDGNLTTVTEIPGGSAADRVTQTWYDWRDRSVAVKAGVEGSESTSVNRPLAYYDYDNLGNATEVRTYDADGVTPSITGGVPQPLSSSLLRSQAATSFDELGRAYHSEVYSVDPSSGSVGSYTLKSDVWRDARGNTIKTAAPGGLVQKMAYDGAGRVTATYLTDGGGDGGYSDADDVTGDTVLEQSETTYDQDGLPLASVTRQRFHDASGTGALGSPSSGIGARVSYAGAYYDKGGRVTAGVDVGTNGGSSWTRPGSVPSRSDTVLVSSRTYDAAGRVYEVTDPRGLVTRTLSDALGRTTTTVENYVNGTVSDTDDKTTTFAYNSAGMTSLTAALTGGGVQTTAWVYGVTAGTGSTITSNDVAAKTRWPDPSTGAASSSEQEATTVNALGQTLTATDRNGSVHALTYDVLGRVVSDAVTTLGSGVDGAVRRVETAYDAQGNAYLVTSYNAASGGSIVNQIRRAFNGLGQMTTEWQEHGGAVNTSTSPKVQYAYSEMASGANHSRLTSVTYPSGYVLTYNYSSGLNSDISRLSSLSDSTGTLESYEDLGLATVVKRGHSQPGVDLTYIAASGTGDAGDQYTGLDRFGRVVDQKWVKSGTSLDRFQYGYDRSGNRLWRDNLINTAFGELYAYDGLNQLASFDRGTLNGTKTGLTGAASRSQDWDFDALGNWDSLTTDGGSPQTRTHNKQNEITAVGGATTPAFDANGNMTGDETGKQFVYDAWNRLAAVKNSGGTTLKTYAYDGLNRRVSETAGGTTTDLFYSARWQVLEEKVGSNTTKRYVWSPVYVDALVLRDRDTDADGTLDEQLWVQQDANFSVTALIDGSGNVVERYGYDPFGSVTVYDASYGVRSGGSSYGFNQGFQGMFFDPVSGTYGSRGRFGYSPTLGRWVQTDPIMFRAGDANLYGFVGNNPGNATDPSGLDELKINVAAFIPDSLGAWRYEPFPSTFGGTWPMFNGNNRPFGGDIIDSKLYTLIVINTDQIGKYTNKNLPIVVDCSPTQRKTWVGLGEFGTDSKEVVDPRKAVPVKKADVTSKCRPDMAREEYGQFVNRQARNHAIRMTNGNYCTSGHYYEEKYRQDHTAPFSFGGLSSTVAGTCQTTISVSASAGYPFLPGPNIDYSFDLLLYISGGNVEVAGSFSHNAFPNYEFYIEHWKDGKFVKKYTLREWQEQSWFGPTPWNLGIASSACRLSATIPIK